MKKINKKPEPLNLVKFRKTNTNKHYRNLSQELRQEIRVSCTEEQFYLCGYCNRRISGISLDTVNEHVIPQHTAPQLSLGYDNIIASCNTPKQCDDSHKAQTLPLTPLMSECEVELKFMLSGRVEGLTERAK